MSIKIWAAGIAAISTLAIAAPAAAVTIVALKCASVTSAAGCLFLGNIGNAIDAAAAESQYNTINNPDIDLNIVGKSDGGFGTLAFADATKNSGNWSTPGFLISFLAVKAGNEFVLYQLAAPASSGTWSTAGLVSMKGIKHELSHLSYFGARGPGAVPEPATWAMMLAGFGLVGGAMRRRRGTLATA